MPKWTQQVAPSSDKSPLWGNESPGVILIESSVSIHSHKKKESRKILKIGWYGEGCGEVEKGLSSVPDHREQGRDQDSKYLLLTRWLGQRSLTFCRLNTK